MSWGRAAARRIPAPSLVGHPLEASSAMRLVAKGPIPDHVLVVSAPDTETRLIAERLDRLAAANPAPTVPGELAE